MLYRPGKSLKRCGKSSSLHPKKTFLLWVRVFCEWHHKWRTFTPPWPTLPGPGCQPLGGSISLKFFLKTRLQSESWYFGWPAGVSVQKLWCKFLFILDHNFWFRNARKLIKGSKDSDSRLVSNENFRKTLWPSCWALGQATWAKMTLKLLNLWHHSQKIRAPQPKIFFECNLLDWSIRLSPWTAL